MPRGGYRAPADPAPVSGPGALSQRTDGGPADSQPIRAASGGAYGERQELENLQREAPLPERRPVDTSGVVPLNAPTSRPGQEITTGAAIPGEGQNEPGEFDRIRIRNYYKVLKTLASKPDVSPATKQLVRQIEEYM